MLHNNDFCAIFVAFETVAGFTLPRTFAFLLSSPVFLLFDAAFHFINCAYTVAALDYAVVFAAGAPFSIELKGKETWILHFTILAFVLLSS